MQLSVYYEELKDCARKRSRERKREMETEKIETHCLLQTANHCKWPQRPEETAENDYQA